MSRARSKKELRAIHSKSSVSKKESRYARPEYDEVRDFFVLNSDTKTDSGLVDYSKLEKKFGKKGAYDLHERGIIYEPIRGKAKLI